MNKTICSTLQKQGKWKSSMCELCRNRNKVCKQKPKPLISEAETQTLVEIYAGNSYQGD